MSNSNDHGIITNAGEACSSHANEDEGLSTRSIKVENAPSTSSKNRKVKASEKRQNQLIPEKVTK